MDKPPARRSRELHNTKPNPLTALQAGALIPEENVWLANYPRPETRQAYRHSVASFVAFAGLSSEADWPQVTPAVVIAWREQLAAQGLSPRTIYARMSALSSLFKHLVNHTGLAKNPVRDVKRPQFSYEKGETKGLSPIQVRKVLDAPPDDTLQGKRDRALLAVGFMAGPRRAELAKLRVRDFGELEGFPALYLRRKRGRNGWVALHQQAALRLRLYLETAGHTGDRTSPLFLPVRDNQAVQHPGTRRHLTPKQIDRIFHRWCAQAGIRDVEYSSHSMRATCATQALRNGATIEEVQALLGHVSPATTKLYDRRDYNPERSASFFATY